MWLFGKRKCNHDWENVASSLYPERKMKPYLPHGWDVEFSNAGHPCLLHNGERAGNTFATAEWVHKKVCLKCGECIDEMEEWTAKRVAKALLWEADCKADRKRKNMAKAMWNECDGREKL
jgi:hypothetical protein